jgi:uncharacterized protein YrzB (UPF0473 family)
MRQASSPIFAPPVEEGAIYTLQDEDGELVNLEFLGLILHNDRRYGFFFPVQDGQSSSDGGEVVILEVTALDEEGQPEEFELVLDEAIAQEVYNKFKQATSGMYDFS